MVGHRRFHELAAMAGTAKSDLPHLHGGVWPQLGPIARAAGHDTLSWPSVGWHGPAHSKGGAGPTNIKSAQSATRF